MKRYACALALLLLSTPLFSDEPPSPPGQLLYVHEEVAKPMMLADYEKATLEFRAAMRKHDIPFYYNAISTDDFHYYYVIPIKSFADIDKMSQTFMTLMSKMGPEQFGQLMMKGGAPSESISDWVVMRRDDLSYVPENPRLKPEEAQYVQYDFYYIAPGTDMMVEEIAKAWKTAFAEKKFGEGFSVYTAVMGSDLPLVIVSTSGKSPEDLAANATRAMGALGGEKMNALNLKTMGNVRKFDTKIGRLRPDLSNFDPGTGVKKEK